MAARRRTTANAPASQRSRAPTGRSAIGAGAQNSFDFVVEGRRSDARHVELRVVRSPAGELARPARVAFSEADARQLHASFYSGPALSGRADIDIEEATAIGKRLAQVLLPAPVFELLATSLDAVNGKGLRIRLSLDASLIDLPWEYVYRPDRLAAEGVSGFLLNDPTISLVRLAADPSIEVPPVRGAASLCFVGTLWEGGIDNWDIEREFTQLRRALLPVSSFVSSRFEVATDLDVKGGGIPRETAIFHYAGHCDIDRSGRGYLIREMPTSGGLDKASKVYIDDLARALANTNTRVVVLSACNGGFWPVAQPLIDAGIPVVIGVNGAVATTSTIEFCTCLYESLALGLGLDEAVDRARLAVMKWGITQQLFDWGLYMVYMASPTAVLFPRAASPAVGARQTRARRAHQKAAAESIEHAKAIDGMNFAEIISDTNRRRVLILGRFKARRLKLLKVVEDELSRHPNRYKPELFTYPRPEERDLIETIVASAILSRFVVADLTEPSAVQAELAKIADFQSVAIVPIIAARSKEYSMFTSNISRKPNVVQPTVRYRDEGDLRRKLDPEIVQPAEARRSQVAPPA